jgi:hypothetical protein
LVNLPSDTFIPHQLPLDNQLKLQIYLIRMPLCFGLSKRGRMQVLITLIGFALGLLRSDVEDLLNFRLSQGQSLVSPGCQIKLGVLSKESLLWSGANAVSLTSQ